MAITKINGGVTAPKGFLASGLNAGIKNQTKKDMAMVFSSTPCAAAGVFTTNLVKAAPVIYQKHVLHPDTPPSQISLWCAYAARSLTKSRAAPHRLWSAPPHSRSASGLQSLFKRSNAAGLLAAMRPSTGHPSICAQSAQVSKPFSRTQVWMGQSLSQNGVLGPSTRQPVQDIMSGVIGTPLSFDQSAAVFSRRAVSFVIVAILASQASQSSPQQPISWFVCFIVVSVPLNQSISFV